jgi:hypothetical protein
MKTDDLIRALAADTVQPRPMMTTLMLGLVPALALALYGVGTVLGFRADLATAMVTPLSLFRIVLSLCLGFAALRLALVLGRPEGRDIARLWPLAAVAGFALGLLGWAYVTTPADARQMATVGKAMVTCLVAIPLLSILPVASVLYALRQGGAPTAPARAGFVAGLAGSGLSAAIYALHCTEDGPLFYVTWYGLAIIGVTLASTLIGARALRW